LQESVRLRVPTVDLNYPGLRLRHKDPPVLEIDNFLSPEDCDALIASAQSDGYQVNSATFAASTAAARTSTTWYLRYQEPAVLPFLQAARALTGIALANIEEPQVVRYELGQQFSWHADAIPPTLLNPDRGYVTYVYMYICHFCRFHRRAYGSASEIYCAVIMSCLFCILYFIIT
jgi:hypothetical protein